MNIEGTKVYRVLKQLSKREKVRLGEFLASPFFNKREDVQVLFQELIKIRTKAIEPKLLFDAIYPKRPFQAQDLRLVCSYLFRLVEHFLVYQQQFSTKNKLAHKQWAMQAFQDMQLDKLAQQNLQSFQRELEAQTFRHANYHFHCFEFHQAAYTFSLTKRPSDKQPFEAMAQALDLAYISFKLRQACHALSSQLAYGHSYQLDFIPELLSYIKQHELQTHISIGLYYYIYQTLTISDSQTAFQQLQQLLASANHFFPPKELRDIYLMLINHRIRGINQGKMEYIPEVFELYKEGLNSDSLLENGELSRFTYSNIVRIALRVQAFDWTEAFIIQYQNLLERPFRSSTFSLNMALLAYTRKDFKQSLHYLQDFDYRNTLLALGAKMLLLKIYFEQGEWDILDSHLQAMSNYIRRQKDLGNYQTNYHNIINYTKRIRNLNPYATTEREELSQAIREEQILTEKEWLLGCLEKV